MKKIIVSFEVGGNIASDARAKDVVRYLKSELFNFARSNSLRIDNLGFTTMNESAFGDFVCKGERCVLKRDCKVYDSNWMNCGKTVIDNCDPETRELYTSKELKQ